MALRGWIRRVTSTADSPVLRPLAPPKRPESRHLDGPPHEPEFWYTWFSLYGQIGDPIERNILESAFGVTEKDASAWWDGFTGWYEGVLDESDGEVDEPGTIRVAFRNNITFRVEAHPGDLYFHLTDGSRKVSVGNIGPHWSLPFVSLDEAAVLANRRDGAEGKGNAASSGLTFMLLAAGIWVSDEDAGQAHDVFVRFCEQSGVVASRSIESLATAWVGAVQSDYGFRRDPQYGSRTSSKWSVRNPDRDESQAQLIADILARAIA